MGNVGEQSSNHSCTIERAFLLIMTAQGSRSNGISFVAVEFEKLASGFDVANTTQPHDLLLVCYKDPSSITENNKRLSFSFNLSAWNLTKIDTNRRL